MEEKVATWDTGDSYQQDIVGGTILLLLMAKGKGDVLQNHYQALKFFHNTKSLLRYTYKKI